MKVGRWRRERMGQNDSHTREVAVVLLLILLFGIYRIFGSAEPELMNKNEVNPDNVLIPMASPADKPSLGNEDVINKNEQGTLLRGSSSEKFENNNPLGPPTDSTIAKELNPPELSSGSGDTSISNSGSPGVGSIDEGKKEEPNPLEEQTEHDQTERNSGGTHEDSPAKHEKSSTEEDATVGELTTESESDDKIAESISMKLEELGESQDSKPETPIFDEENHAAQSEESLFKAATEEKADDDEADDDDDESNENDQDAKEVEGNDALDKNDDDNDEDDANDQEDKDNEGNEALDEQDDDEKESDVDDDDSELGAVKTNNIANDDG